MKLRVTASLRLFLSLSFLLASLFANADSFTLSLTNNGSGSAIENVSDDTTNKVLFFETFDSQLVQTLTEALQKATAIGQLFVNDFDTTTSPPTLTLTTEYDQDFVQSIESKVDPANNKMFWNVDIDYNSSAVVTQPGGSTQTPEPSSLLLLGTSLIGGIGALRRRFPT